jgi:HPt (histidine-containing phosphotransfer) domain-containing protein
MNAIDLEMIDALRHLQEEGGHDLLVELIDLFLQDAPARMAAIRAAVEGRDWAGLTERAHSLKGSCGSLGAKEMAALCARLEAMGTDVAIRRDAATVHSELERQFGLVRIALERERGVTR